MPLSLVRFDAESTFYHRLVAEYGGPVLVLGSALGQVIDGLGERGHAVVGIEPSLRWASAAKERLKVHPQVAVERADFLTFNLKQKFPLVIAPNNCFAFANGQGALSLLLDRVAKHLAPGGALAFEVCGLVTERSAQVPPRAFAAHFLERAQGGAKDNASLLRLRRPFLTAALLEQSLAFSGFEACERYRDFEGEPWDEGDSVQIGVAALKSAVRAKDAQPP
ncbi:MAG: hypothetical protein K1X64_10915 [Myxococcaceae bacterium]|nr:hypothetical protein [Myxococcaceae bacterium]